MKERGIGVGWRIREGGSRTGRRRKMGRGGDMEEEKER